MMERILSVIKTPFRKEYRFYASVLLFMLLASVYLYIKGTSYKISYAIHVNHPGIPLDAIYSKIKSKPLVQKTIDHLPFEVNYYSANAPHKEIYGSALPVKVIINNPVAKRYEHDLLLNPVSSHSYSIDHEDTVQFYEIGEPVKRYYGNFKVVKGLSFKSHFDPLIFRFNQPDAVFASFYQNLLIDSDSHAKTIILSIITTHPLKGEDFLNELIQQYNADNQVPGQTYNYEDSLKLIEQKLASLKLARKPVTVSSPSKQQLKTLEVIRPYVEKPANQFIQVPYTDEVENAALKNSLEKFNKTQLDKQHFLAATKVDDLAVANADKKLSVLRTEILDLLNNKHADINDEHLLKQSASRYAGLIAIQSVKKTVKNAGAISIPDKDDVQIEIAGASFVEVYVCAMLLGLLIPLVFAFIANLDLTMMRGTRFNSQTLAEKLKILFGLSQID